MCVLYGTTCVTNDIDMLRVYIYSLRAGSGVKVELFFNGDVLDPNEDKRLVSQLPFRDRSVCSDIV